MQVVMGGLNGVRLVNLMNQATGKCSEVTAAVAYASQNDPFFEHCYSNKIFLTFYGLLDEGAAVAGPVLQRMLEEGPLAVNPRLIKGHFHSKVIWWHGFGAYIGSANLTSKAWYTNVECGVFFEESEIIGSQLQLDLEQQFSYLKDVSAPVDVELVNALNNLSRWEQGVHIARQKLKTQFDEATKGIPVHMGLTAPHSKLQTTALTRFTTEWTQTLQLLRGLCKDFTKLNKRPVWVPIDAEPAVHFDQFLHAYYYVKVRDEGGDGDSAKSVELVNRAYQKNRGNTGRALAEAADWWAALPEAPYGEGAFIGKTAPWIRERFARAELLAWKLEDFQNVFFEVHAFKTHARQMRNSILALPRGHSETELERSNRVAKWLWEMKREETQRHVKDLLDFLIWGESVPNIAERLWMVTTDPKWRYDHFGPSSLGEAVGWARPDQFPPRNNRTNKALRSLGHDVTLFSA
jgi:hypothetical protein